MKKESCKVGSFVVSSGLFKPCNTGCWINKTSLISILKAFVNAVDDFNLNFKIKCHSLSG